MVQVQVEAATAFTLFGSVVTGEQVGAASEQALAAPSASPGTARRVQLPLV